MNAKERFFLAGTMSSVMAAMVTPGRRPDQSRPTPGFCRTLGQGLLHRVADRHPDRFFGDADGAALHHTDAHLDRKRCLAPDRVSSPSARGRSVEKIAGLLHLRAKLMLALRRIESLAVPAL
jgi:hypothetical protein